MVLLRFGALCLVAALLCWGARRCGSEQSRPPARARTVVGVFECVVGSRRGVPVCAPPASVFGPVTPMRLMMSVLFYFYDTLGFTSAPRSGAVA